MLRLVKIQVEQLDRIRPANSESFFVSYHRRLVVPVCCILHGFERIVGTKTNPLGAHYIQCIPERGVVEKTAGGDRKMREKVFGKRSFPTVSVRIV